MNPISSDENYKKAREIATEKHRNRNKPNFDIDDLEEELVNG